MEKCVSAGRNGQRKANQKQLSIEHRRLVASFINVSADINKRPKNRLSWRFTIFGIMTCILRAKESIFAMRINKINDGLY